MIEVPCTLRCDDCKETKSANLVTQIVHVGSLYPVAAFIIGVDALPEGWSCTVIPVSKLRCPRCNGAK